MLQGSGIKTSDIEERLGLLERKTSELGERMDFITETQIEQGLQLSSIHDDLHQQRDLADKVLVEMKTLRSTLQPSQTLRFVMLFIAIVWVVGSLAKLILD